MKKLSVLVALALVFTFFAPVLPAARAEETITVFNWYDYIDDSVIEQFEEETGIKVKYANFTTVEEMYVKMTSGGGKYDIIIPSDYMIERLIKEDMLQELDYDLIPNAEGLIEWMKDPSYDPEGAHSVPYMWGTVGILYNTEYVDEEITSWQSIFDPKYQKDVFMLKSYRDTIGITLKMLGYPINTHDEEALNAAKEALIQQKKDGIVQGYLVDEVKDKMIGGEAAMAVMWSGDAMYAIMENDSLEYVIPEEGSNVWLDAMCIPKTCENVEAAHAFIDFMCRPDIAYKNMQYIYYSTPIAEVVEMLDEEELEYEALNPSEEAVERCEFFQDTSDFIDIYNKIWNEITA
ncbi:MAG: spermidine/putrescine ABC transporter substrate-binding protein [Clostridia bacterium]|nr:spermidine/putrescine ABC transporter substrate-binding protein [Clostridia bacterium]